MSDSEPSLPSSNVTNVSSYGSQGIFNTTVHIRTESSLVSDRNRQAMLDRVRRYWIEGVFERSLQATTFIRLGLHQRPDLLANPWRLVIQETEPTEYPLPTGTSITEAYDRANGDLLIVGEPGSGKTMLLLQLTRDLLDRAAYDQAHPMPVVFNLSTWAEKRQPIAEWLIEELWNRYLVPQKLGKRWVETDQVLPLLDSLDEVSLAYRAACVNAINAYRQTHSLAPLVVGSRLAEYTAQAAQLAMHTAVMIQPMTSEQIYEYVGNVEGQLGPIQEMLREDPGFQELAANPLTLSLLTLTAPVMPAGGLLATELPSTQTRRRLLLATYVKDVLNRPRPQLQPYSRQLTVRWLAWLAQMLIHSNMTVFYIERMQPTWLPDDRLRRLYHYMMRMGFDGLAIGLTCGLTGGLIAWLTFGLPIIGLASGLLGWLIGGAIRCFLSSRESRIMPAEVIIFSWVRVRRNISVSLVGSLVSGISFFFLGRFRLGLPGGLAFGVIGALIALLFLMLIRGVTYRPLDLQANIRPNIGIHHSLQNSLRLGLIFGFISGFLVGLFLWLLKGGSVGISSGIIVGLLIGMLVWIFNGGRAFVEHFILRALLCYVGYLPWNYPRFLDYATERVLLRRVGGAYIFVHSMLLEYFSSLDIVSVPFVRMRQIRARGQNRRRQAQAR